jgi:hypothetical protein
MKISYLWDMRPHPKRYIHKIKLYVNPLQKIHEEFLRKCKSIDKPMARKDIETN